jgi:hypothetical protein
MEKELNKRAIDDSAPTLHRPRLDMPRKAMVAETEHEPPQSDDPDRTRLHEESNDWALRETPKVSGPGSRSSEGLKGGETRVVTGTVRTAPGRNLADQGIQWRDVLLILGVLMTGFLIMVMIIRLS